MLDDVKLFEQQPKMFMSLYNFYHGCKNASK